MSFETASGSRLALDILADGATRQNPEYEFRLARIALELVRVSDPEAAARLAAIHHSDLTDVFQEAIKDRLGQSDFSSQRGAWLLLMRLADRNVDWAMRILEREWPSEFAKQQALLLSRGNSPMQLWSISKLVDVLPYCDPRNLSRSLFRSLDEDDFSRVKPERHPGWWQTAIGILMDTYGRRPFMWSPPRVEIPNRSSFLPTSSSFSLISASKEPRNPLGHLQTLPFHHPGWAPLISATRFWENPTTQVLKNELQWLAQNWEPNRGPWLGRFPWPLAACLHAAKTKNDLKLLAERAAAGRLGTPEAWAAAEARWTQQGTTEDDFRTMTNERWPFDERIAESGFPFAACNWSLRGNRPHLQTEELLNRFHQTPPSKLKAWIADTILDLLASFLYRDEWLPFSLDDLQEVFKATSGSQLRGFSFTWLSKLNIPTLLSPEWIGFLDHLGQQQVWFYGTDSPCPWTEQLVHSFSSAPETRRGLLPLLVALAVAGNKCEVPREILQLCRDWDDRARGDAALLSLARGDWTSDEAIRLAKDMIESKLLRTTALRALHFLRERFPMERAAFFALVLLKQLQPSSLEGSEVLNEAVSILTEYLNQQPSLLDYPKVWGDLALPEHV